MSEAFVVDPFILAKELQWEIEPIEDPVEAALEASKALALLNTITDARLRDGTAITVSALGAYAFREWDEDSDRFVTRKYNPFSGTGNTEGIGFIQNMSHVLPLQTLFVAVCELDILEQEDEPGQVGRNIAKVPRLLIPVLELESLEVAA